MVQNPKGGGLSSSFGGGGSTQMGGVQKTTDFLDKSTWTLGGLLLVLILLSSIPLWWEVLKPSSQVFKIQRLSKPHCQHKKQLL